MAVNTFFYGVCQGSGGFAVFETQVTNDNPDQATLEESYNFFYHIKDAGGNTVDSGNYTSSPFYAGPFYDGSYRVDITDTGGGAVLTNALLTLDCGNPAPASYVCSEIAATTTSTNTSGAGKFDGGITINADTAIVLQYAVRLFGSTTPLAWQDTKVFAGLGSGKYNWYLREKALPDCRKEGIAFVNVTAAPRTTCKDPQALNYDPTGDTADNTLCEYAPLAEPYFAVPLLNSLRFVQAGGIQNLDNVLFCEERQPGVLLPPYLQKVEKQDTLTIQWLSNYATNTLQIKSYGPGGFSLSLPGVLKEEGSTYVNSFAGFVRPDGAQTRVYFNSGSLPLPFQIGQYLSLENSGAMDGTAEITNIKEDRALGAAYLVVNKTYTAAQPTTGVTITSKLNQRPYNVYEAVLTFGTIPNGEYQAFIKATDPDYPEATAKSEPFTLAPQHPDTVLIEYRNLDNAFDMHYSTGLINRLRVEARLFYREPAGKQELHIEPSGRAVKTQATLSRNVLFETFMLPVWLNEKLTFILGHDYVTLNQVEYQTEEIYKPNTITRYGLAGGSILLRQVQLFNRQNGHDNGLNSAAAGGFIITNGGYLKV